MEFKAILSSDANFASAKQALVHCWNERAGEAHVIEIKPYKKDRSGAQNNYYWGFVVGPIADHCGYTPAEAHTELLGSHFGWKTVRGIDGKERDVPNRRTTEPNKMGTKEFSEYIERCIQIASDLGVMIEPYERME